LKRLQVKADEIEVDQRLVGRADSSQVSAISGEITRICSAPQG